MKNRSRSVLWLVAAAVSLTVGATVAAGEPDCDSLGLLLQNLSVSQIRGNEIWVDHFLLCPAEPETLGGFILSDVTQDRKQDRAVVAAYTRTGWQVRFVRPAPGIRFTKPSPLVDINGDGEKDFLFEAGDVTYPDLPSYRIVIMKSGREVPIPALYLGKGLAVDSVLPAPPGRPRPLVIADRRGWDMSGFDSLTGPTSYRYLEWENSDDSVNCINRTSENLGRFPEMQRRKAYVASLPKQGDIQFSKHEEYEQFVSNIIGYTLDGSNIDQGVKVFQEAEAILERVKYGGPTKELWAPLTVRQRLYAMLPEVREKDKQK